MCICMYLFQATRSNALRPNFRSEAGHNNTRAPCGRPRFEHPSMTKVTLGYTFCEQILSKRAVILQAIPEHVRYLLTLVYVYEHLRKDA